MSIDTATLKFTCTSKGPSDSNSAAKLQLKIGFRYRQAIGELLFAALTCRPDVLFPTILLSQHNSIHVECHHTAVTRVHRHLCSTINDGMYFWRATADPKLPTSQLPTFHNDTHIISMPDYSDFEPISFVDADWVANLNTRRSVSGTALFLVGATINHKCKSQHAVALSST